MEIEVKMPKNIPDGIHVGKIIKIQPVTIKDKDQKEIPYLYLIIESEGFETQYGCSTTLTPNSKLGKLISKFQTLESGIKIDIEKLLIDKPILFQTITSESGYAEIVTGSIKPQLETNKVK